MWPKRAILLAKNTFILGRRVLESASGEANGVMSLPVVSFGSVDEDCGSEEGFCGEGEDTVAVGVVAFFAHPAIVEEEAELSACLVPSVGTMYGDEDMISQP